MQHRIVAETVQLEHNTLCRIRIVVGMHLRLIVAVGAGVMLRRRRMVCEEQVACCRLLHQRDRVLAMCALSANRGQMRRIRLDLRPVHFNRSRRASGSRPKSAGLREEQHRVVVLGGIAKVEVEVLEIANRSHRNVFSVDIQRIARNSGIIAVKDHVIARRILIVRAVDRHPRRKRRTEIAMAAVLRTKGDRIAVRHSIRRIVLRTCSGNIAVHRAACHGYLIAGCGAIQCIAAVDIRGRAADHLHDVSVCRADLVRRAGTDTAADHTAVDIMCRTGRDDHSVSRRRTAVTCGSAAVGVLCHPASDTRSFLRKDNGIIFRCAALALSHAAVKIADIPLREDDIVALGRAIRSLRVAAIDLANRVRCRY